MASNPMVRGRQRALWLRPIDWLWAQKAWIAAALGVLLLATTLYVLWAIKDLPDPSQNVLAAGDVMVLDRNGKLIEDWSPAGHYHVSLGTAEVLLRLSLFHSAFDFASKDPEYYARNADELWIYRYLFSSSKRWAVAAQGESGASDTRIEFYRNWATSLMPDGELDYWSEDLLDLVSLA